VHASMPNPSDPTSPDPSFAELLAVRPVLSLHAQDGLVMEDVPLAAIADAVGTPVWVYSAATIRRRYAELRAALAEAGLAAVIHYAVKANDRLAVLRLLAAEGAGADVVSGGELARALEAGIPPSRIVFSGVGKTPAEMKMALDQGVAQINVESAEELRILSAVAEEAGRKARIALRVNPDVDAKTHPKITTGLAENKFGIPFSEAASLYAEAARLPGLLPVGLAVHIGSQITSLAPFRFAFARLCELAQDLLARGLPLERLDCGGGLGISYRDEPALLPAAYAGVLKATLGGLGLPLIVEPGRWLVGPAGVLVASVVVEKASNAHRFVILDAGMNDLLRPALYGAWHGILPLSAADAAGSLSPAEVVGPVCETGDTFAKGRLLPRLAPGARVAILDAGAYGSVMSSFYNARPLAAEVMVAGGCWHVIRERASLSSLWAGERVPAFLQKAATS